MDEDTRTRRAEEAAGIVEQDQHRREVYAVAGPVGSGKSTFAEAIKEHHDEAVTVFEMSEYVRTLWEADGDASAGFVGDNALGEWAAEKKNRARSVVNGGTAFSTTPFFQDDRESIRPYL